MPRNTLLILAKLSIFGYVYFTFHVTQVQRDEKVGKLGKEISTHMIVEILTALRKLGEELSPEEQEYLKQNSSSSLRQFQQVTSDLGGCLLFLPF